HLEASQWREETLGLWLQYCLSAQAVTLPLLCLLTERLRRRGWALGAASGERAEAAPPLWLLPLLLAALPLALGYLPLLLILPLIGAMLLVLALLRGFPGAFCGTALTALAVLLLPLTWRFGLRPE